MSRRTRPRRGIVSFSFISVCYIPFVSKVTMHRFKRCATIYLYLVVFKFYSRQDELTN